MKVIRKSETESFTNSLTCMGHSFPFGDKAIDIATVTVDGRYPEEGRIVNEVCKEIAYVLSGKGRLVVAGGGPQELLPGDAAMILPGEKYHWEGENLEMLMPCSPAFDPDQHKRVA